MSSEMWTVTSGQFLARDGEEVAMAATPSLAQEICAMLRAQAEGVVLAEIRFDQRLADLQDEFGRQIQTLERRLAKGGRDAQ
jgi:hypothetical protein